jgi:hypothetical protein
MLKHYFPGTLLLLSFATIGLLTSCKKETASATATKPTGLKQGFENIAKVYMQDWAFVNNSVPQGTATWRQGVFVNGFLWTNRISGT